jgi:CYTH domain-containing protein/serine phosphatase RsbU (regulator of sigma subunit)
MIVGVEIERKFLVKDLSWMHGVKGKLYCQGYLSREKERTVRVRRVEDQAFLTVKGSNDGPSRLEYEYVIPVTDGQELLDNLCEQPLIEKVRYRVPYAGMVWEVDEFRGANKGLVVAEIELISPEQEIESPPWLGEEVTWDSRYYNSSLVLRPYTSKLFTQHTPGRKLKGYPESERLLEDKQKALDQDLLDAAKVQQHLLPQSLPLTGMKFSWYFQPCQQVSGDIFNVFRLDADHMALYMVDVSGHGVSAALITALVSEFFSTHGGWLKEDQGESSSGRIRRPVEVVALLDEEFPQERFDCYFTIFYLIVDVHTGEYTYCSAGHPPPFLLSSDGTSIALEQGGVPIGMGTLAPPPDEGSGCFQPGQRLLLYTDGISGYETQEGMMYGSERLLEMFCTMGTLSLEEIKAGLLRDIEGFGEGMEAKDDMSFLLMEFQREE